MFIEDEPSQCLYLHFSLYLTLRDKTLFQYIQNSSTI